jgi:hypothetical protein
LALPLKWREAMRASTAYFAGGGTVILAIVVGIGGGLIMGNMVAPQSPKQGVEQTRLERQKSPEPIQAVAGPSQPVPYLATAQARNEAIAAAPAPTQPQPESISASTAAPPAQTAAATQPAAPQQQAATQPAAAPPQPVAASAQPAAPEPRAAAAEDTQARARDADTRRTVEKRKPERRQQWVESRRRRQPQDLRAVEESVREDTEGRPGREVRVEPVRREFTAEPVRIETPQIRLFGTE